QSQQILMDKIAEKDKSTLEEDAATLIRCAKKTQLKSQEMKTEEKKIQLKYSK
ncbi:hypothetical protein ACJMK2_028772, partial [Sinanodonta woodiana]